MGVYYDKRELEMEIMSLLPHEDNMGVVYTCWKVYLDNAEGNGDIVKGYIHGEGYDRSSGYSYDSSFHFRYNRRTKQFEN